MLILSYSDRIRAGILNLPNSLLNCGKWDHLPLFRLIICHCSGCSTAGLWGALWSRLQAVEAMRPSLCSYSFNQDLKVNSHGTGYDGVGHASAVTIDFSGSMGVPVARQLVSWKSITCCLILSKSGHRDFGPDPGDVVHFVDPNPLRMVILIEVKSRTRCFLKRARGVACLMLMQYAYYATDPANMASDNFALTSLCRLKEWLGNTNYMPPFPTPPWEVASKKQILTLHVYLLRQVTGTQTLTNCLDSSSNMERW